MKTLPFNKPKMIGKELAYIEDAISRGKISGDGYYTELCTSFFKKRYNFNKVLLTTSCTDALEMAAILLNISPGDEVIVPSYTFVSTANAFALRGAKILFADSSISNPNICPQSVESLITKETKAIVVVHYAGVACDMDLLMQLSSKYRIPIIEDAAQAIDSYWNSRPLGSIGQFGTFSFHETKNIISGEGGMISINSSIDNTRSEIIREKGTNRSSFFRGEINKYGWVDIGSSFLPSEITSAYLYAQCENIEKIQNKRKYLWGRYLHLLKDATQKKGVLTPDIPSYASNNAHMFYLVCESLLQRTEIIARLRSSGIMAPFHYTTLHDSDYFKSKYKGPILYNAKKFSDCIFRLPLFYDLTDDDIDYICENVISALG
jgi:dTDP-4-amino-4,6-dideoxygalactose transaminase